jgi:hypothetical protein
MDPLRELGERMVEAGNEARRLWERVMEAKRREYAAKTRDELELAREERVSAWARYEEASRRADEVTGEWLQRVEDAAAAEEAAQAARDAGDDAEKPGSHGEKAGD